jgi:excisionase family DNA binding protein
MYLATCQIGIIRNKIKKREADGANPMLIMTEDEVLTTDEALEYLKISRPTFLKCVHQGRIKAIKVGSGWRVLKSELYQFLKGSRISGGQ